MTALPRLNGISDNPTNYTDPSGHCEGHYDTQTGQATADQGCWDFVNLEKAREKFDQGAFFVDARPMTDINEEGKVENAYCINIEQFDESRL